MAAVWTSPAGPDLSWYCGFDAVENPDGELLCFVDVPWDIDGSIQERPEGSGRRSQKGDRCDMQSLLIGFLLAIGWGYVLGLAVIFGLMIILGRGYFWLLVSVVAVGLLVAGRAKGGGRRKRSERPAARSAKRDAERNDDKPVSEQWQRMLDYRKRKEAERKRENLEVELSTRSSGQSTSLDFSGGGLRQWPVTANVVSQETEPGCQKRADRDSTSIRHAEQRMGQQSCFGRGTMWSPRSRQSYSLRTGEEAFRVRDEDVGPTICDYWSWANSDLLDNASRGVLAEFLVAHALHRTNEPRREWGAFDVRTESGLKVEVKSAAYAQSWPQERPSEITFNIAPRKSAWDPETNKTTYFEPPARPADVYVFCLLGHPDDPDPDPMDLDEWEFYVLATEALDRERPRQKTIALNPLKSLVRRTAGRSATPYGTLADEIERSGRGSKCGITLGVQ